MAEPFLAEIRIFSFDLQFIPKGWAQCAGQLLPINQNQPLFALLGTGFGGDGRVNFALPDLRGRVPMHAGGAHQLCERGGQEVHTVTQAEMPAHTHVLQASNLQGNSSNPRFGGAGHVLAQDPGNAYSGNVGSLAALQAGSISNVGGSQPHVNMQPYLALNFCIALIGIFPDLN